LEPLALIIRTAGTNCDRELAYAFELAQAKTQTVHLNELIDKPGLLASADLIGIPGGFSYGDDIAAGRIFANRLRHKLWDALQSAMSRKIPVIGICNGFQVLVKLGLLPDPTPEGGGISQAVTLTDNTQARFVARWVPLEVPRETVCIWTGGLEETFELPIAHGEGRFVTASDKVLDRLNQGNQIALRYVCQVDSPGGSDGNPNGSVDRIAGICDPSGLVLGLMPHPERYTHVTHHPQWTSSSKGRGDGHIPAGLRLFQNAVAYAQQARAARPSVSGAVLGP